ncbi:uncharacterized protein DUF4382 [Pseudoduganella lurida]|uniref:Uncharacterized protein DUF4382 n=1 Tax=Pseudoduganella lurida TaxID=1036180 RepID=A0A562RAL1_9BURK|nr:DUF4382 domain-containing protein [Pseudoduganella lurida]TWI65416.1 uncharacterized protein DUF4382 [Pseudoduganella lurida]
MNQPIDQRCRWLACTIASAVLLSACGGGDDDDPPAQEAARGTVLAKLQTGANACGLDAVNVTVSKLRLNTSANAATGDSGWVDLALAPAQRINLIDAATVPGGATTDLGEVSLPAGIYTQARLVLDAAGSTVRVAGAAADTALTTDASLGSDGIRVPVDVKVDSAGKATLVVDFNGCGSIQRRGSAYVLKPRAAAVQPTLNGIAGFIDKAALASGIVITAQQNGGIFATAVPHPTTGEFLLPRLPANKYDVVIQGRGRATAVIGAVPVEAAAIVAIATAAAPIAPATSATATVSGQVSYAAGKAAPDSGTWVQAAQTIAASINVGNLATPVTYRLQPVDLASGAYTLPDLPRASIQYALYKPALPLALANATTSLGNGRYRIDAVAAGYSNTASTASTSVDINATSPAGINIVLTQ